MIAIDCTSDKKELTNIGLITLLAGLLLPLIDFSILNVALSSIADSIHASHVELELMVAIYGVAFSVSIAMAGKLGDSYGRRRLFCYGVTLFGLASLACGLSNSIEMLLIARGVQGIGAALLIPQILATIHISLSGKRHSIAIGSYSSIGGMAFILGQLLGGWLVFANIADLGWRSVFLVNVPISIVILIGAWLWIPETTGNRKTAIDWSGTCLLALALMCLLLAISLGPLFHWTWPFLSMLVAVVPLLLILWNVEKSKDNKQLTTLLPPTLMRQANVQFSFILAMLMFTSWGGFMFSVALVLQSGLGFLPIESGNSFIAMGATFFIGSILSPKVVAKLGNLKTVILGCVLQLPFLISLILTFHMTWPDLNELILMPATAGMGFAQAFIVTGFFRIGLAKIQKEQAGTASAMLATIQQATLAIGTALLGTVTYQVLESTGDYLTAITTMLLCELFAMVLLTCAACWFYSKRQVR
ncbi:MFS transporter [Marinomonas mediterranea]|jgi:Arabinose efflux permease|uniref:Major facilitator superfamily MFS_1 n=1 Tax=Marinomonas mediterranea (strain ATCC 700492 / JCM 21426 / NBRC 103028 / MMB-1) TaxID=717774 RepID=F2JYL0_MARM1|nr:MFS transporter [Marinomonas mediterranea]ADZ93139.1 major facilitator superfamily MFS_1 [Marinomonas mediterranea MMB-1]WCN15105.1 MFS transporter [Marinomonas mediterranea]WCN19148.1 MFS transporter [Marinomonas mediterranea MMB-1]